MIGSPFVPKQEWRRAMRAVRWIMLLASLSAVQPVAAGPRIEVEAMPSRGSFGSAQSVAALDQCLRRTLAQYGEARSASGRSTSLVFGKADEAFTITLSDQGDTRLVEVMAEHKLRRGLIAQIHSCLY